MPFVGRRLLLLQPAASQSGSLGRETAAWCRFPVDPIEDRPLVRRRLRPDADRLATETMVWWRFQTSAQPSPPVCRFFVNDFEP